MFWDKEYRYIVHKKLLLLLKMHTVAELSFKNYYEEKKIIIIKTVKCASYIWKIKLQKK